ncbi:MAG: hypothetical protein V4655_14520 [Bdellovibrionota bacterium]|nr:MAG: hypothetical protein EOP10_14055 [Pseudomonadota bacterium]
MPHRVIKFWQSLILIAGLFLSDLLYACPGLLLAQHIPFFETSRIRRDRLSLYSYNGKWTPIPLQLDPLDRDGALVFPKDAAWTKDNLEPKDRLSFNIDQFAARYDTAARLKTQGDLPCGTRELIELKYQGKYAYLMTCEQDPIARQSRPVTHDEAARTVRTGDYSYVYTKSNHLVFENIKVAESNASKTMIPVAKDSDLLIVGDVKKFFTLYFDSSDIDAEIKYKRQGAMGLMGGMEFFLRIMAFKIDLQLLPEVNFFEDSMFMPMMMTLPVDARTYLRRGSGIYYSWASEPDVEWLWNESRLDDLNLELLNPNSTLPLSLPSSKHCDSRYCLYTIVAKAKGRPFVMNFKINRKAADLGFFPQLIRDVSAAEKKIGHKLGRFPAAGRVAIYFETARLPKGTHTWDFWIYFPDKNADEKCTFRIDRENVSSLLKG